MAQPDLHVLILGSGGREHTLLKACLASPRVARVIAAPGNGGMAAEASCHAIDAADGAAVLALAQAEGINFVIIGPEAPLAAGVADVLRAAGLAVYGPGSAGARLEASKAYCKAFLEKYAIPTAAYARFAAIEPALAWLDGQSFPLVVKASGLAAGKGVIICADRAAAEQALRAMLVEDRFGASGREVVIEEFLTGEEASLMVLIAGDQYVCLPPIQDHKRIGEGDSGPNTGGMGAYAPAPVLDADGLRRVEASIIRPTLAGLRAEGIDYRGTLFIGLMIEHGAAKVLEFNVRFGDPECQAVLPLCASDPVDLLHACATGSLQADTVRIHPDHTLIVVLAARGYPGDYPKGDCIGLPDTLPDNVSIIHAGTRRDADGTIRANGGRVLGVVGRGPTLAAAADAAYAVCAQIRWANAYYRRDIGWRALRKDRV